MIRSDRQCSPTENKRANWPAIRSHRPIPARDPECAAKASTSTIPIVFWATSDPVGIGLVPSLNRPGGNVTGMSLFNPVLSAKRLELLREMVPRAAVIAYLLNPGTPSAEIESREALAAASALGIQLHILHASSEQDLDAAFATVTRLRAARRIREVLRIIREPSGLRLRPAMGWVDGYPVLAEFHIEYGLVCTAGLATADWAPPPITAEGLGPLPRCPKVA
jgi:hypothetical protein